MFRVRMKELREKTGDSQYAFAEKFGVAQSTVGGWESGVREPNFMTAQKLADYFGVSVDYLLGRKRTPDITDDSTSDGFDTLTAKDRRDIAKRLNSIIDAIDSDEALMFDGEPMDDETRELLKASLEVDLKVGKSRAKEKYTPHKYKK